MTKKASKEFEKSVGPPTLTGRHDSPLKLSVITSSTETLAIAELLVELWVLRVYGIDFYPRGLDIQKAFAWDRGTLESEPLLDRFCKRDFVTRLGDYVNKERERAAALIATEYGEMISPSIFEIPAVATFFPEITSFDPSLADKAVAALVNSARLAAQLGSSVVEFVLGKTVERCRAQPLGIENRRLRCDYVHKSTHSERMTRALNLLVEVVRQIKSDEEIRHVRLAAEIEPGYSYVLNSRQMIHDFLDGLADKGIEDMVGLNLDIGHALILSYVDKADSITPRQMAHWKKNILHAHVSDNVGYHFRDLVPGTYHWLDGHEEDYDRTFRRWLELCTECSQENQHFTKYVALELEACGRTEWIQRSLLRVGYVIRNMSGSKLRNKP